MPDAKSSLHNQQMKYVAAFLVALLCGVAVAQDEKKYDMKVIQLVFLNSPDKAPKISNGEAEKLQTNHLKFLEKLWASRTALCLGPLADAGKIRGIVLLDVETKEKALEIMKSDPFIRGGHLVPDVRPVFCARNVPQKGEKFRDLDSLWFGLLVRPANAPQVSEEESKTLGEGHMANINKMAASGDLVLAGPFAEDTAWRGFLMFRTKERKQVEDLVAQDPAVKRGRFELQLYQWYTAKGTFPEK